MVGDKPQTINVSGKKITIGLESSGGSLDEVIVVGYGTQKKTKMTSAVSSLNARELLHIPPPIFLMF
jgi:hypothetical protein